MFSFLCFISYKLIITVEDNTSNTTFVVFVNDGEKVVNSSITKLALLNQSNKYVLPQLISKLIDQQKLFTVALVTKSLKIGELLFRVLNCHVL